MNLTTNVSTRHTQTQKDDNLTVSDLSLLKCLTFGIVTELQSIGEVVANTLYHRHRAGGPYYFAEVHPNAIPTRLNREITELGAKHLQARGYSYHSASFGAEGQLLEVNKHFCGKIVNKEIYFYENGLPFRREFRDFQANPHAKMIQCLDNNGRVTKTYFVVINESSGENTPASMPEF